MRRHIIRPLKGMGIERVVFRYQSIEPVLQVYPCTVIVVFLNQQARGGVLDEKCTQPFFGAGLAEQGAQAIGKGVKALAVDGYV
jgi:hypothetical protein